METPSKDELLKAAEDEMMAWVDALPPWKRAVAYRYLNGSGITLDRCDKIIEDGLKEEASKEFFP